MSDETTPGPDLRAYEAERDRHRWRARADKAEAANAQLREIAEAWKRRPDRSAFGVMVGTWARVLQALDISPFDDQMNEKIGDRISAAHFERAEQAEAAVARLQALAEDMRTWCSPHGIAVTYAQRIEEAINPPERDDDALPAVREFAAKHDPRQVERPPTITEILDHAAKLDRLRRNGGPT